MIIVDMPVPDRCLNCPLSYMVMYGDMSGETICQAMEANGKKLSSCLVDIRKRLRPIICPIVGMIDDDGK